MRLLIAFIISICFAGAAFANGHSFYQRIATEKDGKLSFDVAESKDLPESQRIILSCSMQPFDKKALCAEKAVNELRKEAEKEKNPSIKAWKLYLIGTVYFEAKDFDRSLAAYNDALARMTDDKFRASTIHRIIIIGIMKRDADNALKMLDKLEKEYPEYRDYDRIFSTYPASICDPAWNSCAELPPVQTMIQWKPVLKGIESTAHDIRSLESKQALVGDAYVETYTQLGKLYEEACPVMTMFDRVCPDALNIYREIVREYPRNKKTDLAFLKVQQSKFAYEYEGDEMERSKDIIKNYGPFLDKYPDSELAEDIRKEYERAKQYIDTH
ncbi:MAG: hypothetical protein ACFE95_20505 [Candidatus Hodarchaeota archaeon]